MKRNQKNTASASSAGKESAVERGKRWLEEEFGIRPERKKQPMTRERVKGIVITLAVIAVMIAVMVVILRPVRGMLSDPEQIRAYIEGLGPVGIFAFMGMNILQVFAAVVPGGPFEIAAGYIYGVFKGALICDAAMTLGSICTFLLGRTLGLRFVRIFVTEDELKNAKILRTSGKSTLLTFLLFLIPGTPKDMLSYLVGLTDMKLHVWIAICAVGRFPAILLSTASGIELQQGRYGIFLFMLILTGVLSLGGLWFYHRRSKAVQEEDEEDSGPDRGDRDRRQRPEARPERDLT